MADQSFGILEVLLLGARAFGLFAAFAALAWGLMRMRREQAEQQEILLSSQRELASQNQALAERIAGLSSLVTVLVANPRRPAEPLVEAPEPQAPPPPFVHKPRRHTGVPSYETAKRMAREGASVEEIVASCGVAGTEARLLRRLHGTPLSNVGGRENAA
jgi:Protein of unknown function (DUF2802)